LVCLPAAFRFLNISVCGSLEQFKKVNMKSISYKLVLSMAILLMVGGCGKDEVVEDPEIINPVIEVENERLDAALSDATISTFLQGYIQDENGNAVANVEVKTATYTTTTDADGYFAFGAINIKKEFTLVKAQKAGYLLGTRTLTPTIGAVNTINIQLMTKSTPKTLTASAGGMLDFESGQIQLDFPENAIVTTSGNAYSGNVKVYARYINPTADNFLGIMPGILAGLDADNDLVGMVSLGMLSVELEDDAGNALEIAGGKTVKVTMPAAIDAPATIPTWHFNETYGVWVEAGVATKTGDTYTFDANYFSTWNIDYPIGPSYDVTLTIENEANEPIPNLQIGIFTENGENPLAIVYSDNNGQFTLLNTPENINLNITLNPNTASIIKPYTIIGPTGTIIITNSDIASTGSILYRLSGQLKDCDGVLYGDKYYRFTGIDEPVINFTGITDGNGNYSAVAIMSGLSTINPYDVRTNVFISNTEAKSDTVQITFSGNSQVKDIDFCGIEIVNTAFNPSLTYGEVTDIEGNIYKTIVIGSQTWMAENLKTSKYNDGTSITTGLGGTAWQSNTSGAYAIYDNNAVNNTTYGKLYNWNAVNTGKLCPEGWHIPSDAEWTVLTSFLGGEDLAGGKMKSTSLLWPLPNDGATNESGFSGLPGGNRYFNGSYTSIGFYGRWWSSTEYEFDADLAWYRFLYYDYEDAGRSYFYKDYGLSCRCIKD
jgi:uncharacterized protein (TIGR02145 family)